MPRFALAACVALSLLTSARPAAAGEADDLRDKAREPRLQGMTYSQIQAELGCCSKSSVSLWVRDLPNPKADHRSPAEQGRDAARRRWTIEGPIREARRGLSRVFDRPRLGELRLVPSH